MARGEKLFLHPPQFNTTEGTIFIPTNFVLFLVVLFVHHAMNARLFPSRGSRMNLNCVAHPFPGRDRLESLHCRLRKSAVKAFRG